MLLGGTVVLGLLVVIGLYLVNVDEPDGGKQTAFSATVLMAQVGVVAALWSRLPLFRLLAALAPIPLGFATWFLSMAVAFDGGGRWTAWGMQAGFWMMLGGIVQTVVVLCTPRK
jgi:hypothetical protein